MYLHTKLLLQHSCRIRILLRTRLPYRFVKSFGSWKLVPTTIDCSLALAVVECTGRCRSPNFACLSNARFSSLCRLLVLFILATATHVTIVLFRVLSFITAIRVNIITITAIMQCVDSGRGAVRCSGGGGCRRCTANSPPRPSRSKGSAVYQDHLLSKRSFKLCNLHLDGTRGAVHTG